jgi:two-component system, OmpR family, phosphate regulon response regulator OmpR
MQRGPVAPLSLSGLARTIDPMPHLLMIDDDARLAAMVRDYLASNGFAVQSAGSAAAGLEQLAREPGKFDLVLLDLMLPDGDGLDLCRRIRAQGDENAELPILMLTAKGDPLDRVVGLEIGADDYLPKPFGPRELLARIRAVLRRRGEPRNGADVLRFGALEIDRGARAVRVGGATRSLTSHQFDLLVLLAERAGRVLSREQILDLMHGAATDPAFDRSIDVHIARIRAAIEDDPRSPKRIVTVRGAGYVFARTQDA